MRDKIEIFLKSNKWEYRLLRTIVQGVLAVIVQAVTVGNFSYEQLIAPAIMAILSPVMALFNGNYDDCINNGGGPGDESE